MNAVDFPSLGQAEALRQLSVTPSFLQAALVRAAPEVCDLLAMMVDHDREHVAEIAALVGVKATS